MKQITYYKIIILLIKFVIKTVYSALHNIGGIPKTGHAM